MLSRQGTGPTLPSATACEGLGQLSRSYTVGAGLPLPWPSGPAPLCCPGEVQGPLPQFYSSEGARLILLDAAGASEEGKDITPTPMVCGLFALVWFCVEDVPSAHRGALPSSYTTSSQAPA